MKFPKLVIASDGKATCALLDGVFLADGIGRLDFSAHREDGKLKHTIRVMDLDVEGADLSQGPERFSDFIEKMAENEEYRKKNITKYLVCECGKEFHPSGALFCSDCGRRLKDLKEAPATTAEVGA